MKKKTKKLITGVMGASIALSPFATVSTQAAQQVANGGGGTAAQGVITFKPINIEGAVNSDSTKPTLTLNAQKNGNLLDIEFSFSNIEKDFIGVQLDIPVSAAYQINPFSVDSTLQTQGIDILSEEEVDGLSSILIGATGKGKKAGKSGVIGHLTLEFTDGNVQPLTFENIIVNQNSPANAEPISVSNYVAEWKTDTPAPTPEITIVDVTDKVQGDTVKISGTSNLNEVNVKVAGPSTTVSDKLVTVQDGAYTSEVILPEDAEVGEYTITVSNGDTVKTDTFNVVKKQVQISDITVTTAFDNNGVIADKYSKDGGNTSLPVSWTEVPEAKSYALIMLDPDANDPNVGNFVHWAVKDINKAVSQIQEGVSGTANMPGVELTNSFAEKGYGGPQPPNTHNYKIVVYALNTDTIDLQDAIEGITQVDFEAAIQGKVIGRGEINGTFTPKAAEQLTVSVSPESGTFDSFVDVELTANRTATIYYTTDGTEPTTSSTVYNGPIHLTATTTLKYYAVDTNGNSTDVQSVVFTKKDSQPEDPNILQVLAELELFADQLNNSLDDTQKAKIDKLKELLDDQGLKAHLIQIARDSINLDGEVKPNDKIDLAAELFTYAAKAVTLTSKTEVAEFKKELAIELPGLLQAHDVDPIAAFDFLAAYYGNLKSLVQSGTLDLATVKQAFVNTLGSNGSFYGLGEDDVSAIIAAMRTSVHNENSPYAAHKATILEAWTIIKEQFKQFVSNPVVTITLDDVTAKTQGDQVTISGKASHVSNVTIDVKKPDGTSLTGFPKEVAVNGGQYTYTFTLDSNAAKGMYKVTVSHGDVKSPEKSFVVNEKSSGGSGGGGGGVGNNNAGGVDSGKVSDATKNINTPGVQPADVKNELKNLTVAETKKVLDDLAKVANVDKKVLSAVAAEYVKKAAQQELKAVTANGKSVATATGEQLKSVVKKAVDAFKEAKDILNKAGVKDTTLKAYVTFTVPDAAEDTTVTFSLSDLEAAMNGVDKNNTEISYVSQGVTVNIAVTDILNALTSKASLMAAADNNDYSVTINKLDAPKSAPGLQALTGVKVIELNVNSKDRAVTKFNQPVTVEIEVGKLPVGTNAEKVQAYKLVDGSWVPVGGKYADGVITFTTQELGQFTAFISTKTFTDIGSVEWAQKAIETMAAKGIITGRSETKFAPHDNVTRAEFASLLVRALDLHDQNATAAFKDVKSSDWFSSAVGSAVKAGIVKGVSADQFKPNASITRQEMVTMLANALKLNGASATDIEKTLATFTDKNNIQGWAKEAVALSVQYDLVKGMPNGTFAPNAKATRAQAAVVIYNLTKVEQ